MLDRRFPIIMDMVSKGGAHFDLRNTESRRNQLDCLSSGQRKQLFAHDSLKCMAARAVMKHQVRYKDQGLPTDLVEFIDEH